MIKVRYAKFDHPLKDSQFQELLAELPEKFHEKILKYVHWRDQHTSLIGKILLSRFLEEKEWSMEQFTVDLITGRPKIQGAAFDFNISHSGNLVVLATNEKGRVGVDVEFIEPMELETFRKFMREEEYNALLSDSNPVFSFYRMWTIKESVIKADGRGLSIPLESIYLEDNMARVEGGEWFFKSIPDCIENVQLSVCSDKEEALMNLDIQEISFQES